LRAVAIGQACGIGISEPSSMVMVRPSPAVLRVISRCNV
jgi:hypothetical protein